jgi:protein phosphatase
MDCCGATDVGKKRPSNEDQFLIAELNKSLRVHQTSLDFRRQTRLYGGSQGHLLAVADGMGGRAAGERASTLAIDSMLTYVLDMLQWYFRLDQGSDEEFRDDLKAALHHCQERITLEMAAMPKRDGMGATLTMAYIIWPRMYVVHVGDSRCYLFRGGELKQITRDHTVAEMYVERGAMSPEDAESSKWSHVLWNVLGGDTDELSPEVYLAHLQPGDTVLLCTDGLSGCVPREEIIERLRGDEPAEGLCRQLVSDANGNGGADNITVVVARFLEPGDQLDQKEAAVDLENSQGDGKEPDFERTSADRKSAVPMTAAEA